MIRPVVIIALLPMLALGACNRNTSPGNDRESQIDPAPAPARVASAAEALAGIAVEAVQPETMSDGEVAALGGPRGRCFIRLTSVGFPSFVHDGPGGKGAIKLNGTLIPLRARQGGIYESGGLGVVIRPVRREFGSDGLRESDMIVMLPGARDELGYRGYEDCSQHGL
ncbi:MAG: DUF6692 family protein [Sphingomonadales bacterium]